MRLKSLAYTFETDLMCSGIFSNLLALCYIWTTEHF